MPCSNPWLAGCPALTHPACGAAEVIENNRNGFLREMDNADALASVIDDLAGDADQLRKVGQTARSDAEEKYSLAAMIDTYSQLYLEVAGLERGNHIPR